MVGAAPGAPPRCTSRRLTRKDASLNSPARPVELAATLRQLRASAGLSGVEAARRAGLSQPKISRLENGRQVPTSKEIAALCRAYRASTEQRAELQAIVRALVADTTPTRIVLQQPHRFQARIGRIEQSSSLLRSFQPGMVIGLAQTADYARTIMFGGTDPLDDDTARSLVEARLRRQEILGTDRRFVLVHTEGALRWHIGSPSIMASQLDHLTALAERSNLRIGVIPWQRPVTIGARHAFHLYDSRTAIVGTESGTAIITEPREVNSYERRFTELEAVAAFGPDAQEILARLANDYRALG